MNDLVKVFDSKLLKMLSEPVRIEIVKVLAVGGRMDIGSITEKLPQDRSVTSRHLSAMHDVGLLTAEKEGRHKMYELDGRYVLDQLEGMAQAVRGFFMDCCPETLKKS